MADIPDNSKSKPAKHDNELWEAELTPASSIKPELIRWMWTPWIAKGKFSILAGAGASGKTTLAISLIGTLTSGGYWPDGSRCSELGNAVIWSSEDDPADTLVPRLLAAGADLDRVHIINGKINAAGKRQPFDPAKDFDLLRAAIDGIGGISLLLIDPVVNLVLGDMHKGNDVRRSLQIVVDFASAHDCSVLGITHFSKSSAASSPIDRVLGSQAFSALARIVLVAAKSADSETRVLARAKSNIGDDQGGVSYVIETCAVEDGIETIRVSWGELIEGSAEDILAGVEFRVRNDALDDDPSEALHRILRDGPISNKEAKQLMTENGYSIKQTRTARERLRVLACREGFGTETTSYWSLPES